jgi:hypothetical protein
MFSFIFDDTIIFKLIMKKGFFFLTSLYALLFGCSKHDNNNTITGPGKDSLVATYSKPKTVTTMGYTGAIAGRAGDSIVYNITYDAQGRVLTINRRAWLNLAFSADHDSIFLKFSYDQNKTIRTYFTSSNPTFSSQDIYYKNPNAAFLDSSVTLDLINNIWVTDNKTVYTYNTNGYANKSVQTAFNIYSGTVQQVSTTDYAWLSSNQLTMTITSPQYPNSQTIFAYTYYDQQQRPFPIELQETFAYTGLYYPKAIKQLSEKFTGTNQINEDYNYTSFTVDKNNNLLTDTVSVFVPSMPDWKSFYTEKLTY